MDGESFGEALGASALGRVPAKLVQEPAIENEGEPKLNYTWKCLKCDCYFTTEEAYQARSPCPGKDCDLELLTSTVDDGPWKEFS